MKVTLTNNLNRGSHIKLVILHIGMYKTATTSIQHTLAKNPDELSKHGIAYLKSLGVNQSWSLNNLIAKNPHSSFMNVKHEQSEKNVTRSNQILKSKLEDEITGLSDSIHTIVFSAEGLGSISNNQVKKLRTLLIELFPQAHTEVICSTRECLSYYTSRTGQKIKTEVVDINNLSTLTFPTYRETIEKYIDNFGVENVNVYSFEEAVKHKKGPVGYFLDLLGVPVIDLNTFNLIQRNESISSEAIDLIYDINCQLPLIQHDSQDISFSIKDQDTRESRISSGRVYGDISPIKSVPGEKFLLSERRINEIWHDNQSDIRWLKKHFDIDYTNRPKLPKKAKLKLDEKYFQHLQKAFLCLSPPLKKLCYNYLANKFESSKEESEKDLIQGFLMFVESTYNSVIQKELFQLVDKVENQKDAVNLFKTTLNLKPQLHPKQVYKPLSYFLQSLGLYSSALEFTKLTLQFQFENPNNWIRYELLAQKMAAKTLDSNLRSLIETGLASPVQIEKVSRKSARLLGKLKTNLSLDHDVNDLFLFEKIADLLHSHHLNEDASYIMSYLKIVRLRS